MNINLDDLKAKAEAATPGEWFVAFGGRAEDTGFTIGTRACGGVVCECYPPLSTDYHAPDAAFIASANPQTILQLIAEIERLQKLVSYYESPSNEAHTR